MHIHDNSNGLFLFSIASVSSLDSNVPHTNHRSFLHNTLVQKAVHVFKGGTETTSERRAMKVLGIVFFVFLVAWLPFSILNILSTVCPSCRVKPSLLNLTSWLGYISSNLNPVNTISLHLFILFLFAFFSYRLSTQHLMFDFDVLSYRY